MSFIDKVKDLIADNADKVLEAAIAKAGRYFEKAGDTGGTRKSPHRVRSRKFTPLSAFSRTWAIAPERTDSVQHVDMSEAIRDWKRRPGGVEKQQGGVAEAPSPRSTARLHTRQHLSRKRSSPRNQSIAPAAEPN
jgi:hypothetical protein